MIKCGTCIVEEDKDDQRTLPPSTPSLHCLLQPVMDERHPSEERFITHICAQLLHCEVKCSSGLCSVGMRAVVTTVKEVTIEFVDNRGAVTIMH